MYMYPDGTTSADGFNVITELIDCRYETVLWAAMKYALCLEEGDVVEAVMAILKPRVGYMSNETLSKMRTAVEEYVYRGRQYEFDARFIPEWSDVLAWITAEMKIRAEVRNKQIEEAMAKEVEEGEGKCRPGAF